MRSSSGGRGSRGQRKSGEGSRAVDAKARLLAVEVLLADPEQLENDALEGDLYILRDKLILQEVGGRLA
jgi:hypothetical protein